MEAIEPELAIFYNLVRHPVVEVGHQCNHKTFKSIASPVYKIYWDNGITCFLFLFYLFMHL